MLDIEALVDAVVSHAMLTASFERVNQHEPKNAPGNGLTCAVWMDRVDPAKSGLNSTSARVAMKVRIYSNMLQEPQDMIDIEAVKAFDLLMKAYNGDFQLDGMIRQVDIMGEYGVPLSAIAGYLEQDSRMFRVLDITLPLIVNDVWTQTP